MFKKIEGIYNVAKTPITHLKNIVSSAFGKGKVSPDIKSVAPNVPVTKADKVKRDLRLATQKSKTSQVRLDNTIFRIEQQKKRLEDKLKTKSQTQTRPGKQNLSKGGRAGFKRGTGLMQKKSNVKKIKETFGPKKGLGMQSVIYGLDKNPKITAADPKAKFIAAANKKKKKKVI